MRYYVKCAIAGLFVAMLVGCKALGLATPQTFDQQLANAYGVHTAVVQGAANALTAGSISKADAISVQGFERSSRAILDTARAAELAGDTAGAQKNLALALTALNAIQTYINAQGKK